MSPGRDGQTGRLCFCMDLYSGEAGRAAEGTKSCSPFSLAYLLADIYEACAVLSGEAGCCCAGPASSTGIVLAAVESGSGMEISSMSVRSL